MNRSFGYLMIFQEAYTQYTHHDKDNLVTCHLSKNPRNLQRHRTPGNLRVVRWEWCACAPCCVPNCGFTSFWNWFFAQCWLEVCHSSWTFSLAGPSSALPCHAHSPSVWSKARIRFKQSNLKDPDLLQLTESLLRNEHLNGTTFQWTQRLSGKSRKSYSFFSFYLLSPCVDLLFIYQKWHCGNTNSCTFFGKQQKQLHHLSRLASNIRMQHLQAEAVACSLSFCNFSAPRNVMSTSKILNKNQQKMLGLDFAEVGCTNLCLKIQHFERISFTNIDGLHRKMNIY